MASIDAFQRLIAEAPIAIAVTTAPEQEVVSLNLRFTKLFGYTREEVPTIAAWWPLAYPDAAYRKTIKTRWARLVARTLRAQERAESTVAVVRCKDGSSRRIRFQLALITGRFILFLSDITEQAHMSRRLLETEENWKSIVKNAPDTILLIDRSGRIEFVNRPGPLLEGVAAPGASVFDSIPDSAQPHVRDIFARVMETGASENSTLETTGRDGRKKLYSIGVGPIRKDGRISSLMILAADITQRQETERKLEQTEQQLRQAQKMEAVGRLAGGVAHDFNNLLTTILGYCEMLREGMPKKDPRQEEVEEIQNAADRAAALTRQLLAFSRRQILAPRILDINDSLKEIEKMLRRLIGEDIELVMKLDSKLKSVKADPGQMTQVIMNLAVNSRDAMPKGGRLLIETRNLVLDEGILTRHDFVASGPYVLISVSDTGCGMSAEVQAHLFEPFYTTKEKGKGTGLGLSTVYGIIKQSNGYIWAYSEPDKGAVFKIYLPTTDARPQAAQPADSPESLRGTETILLVEDDESVRRMLAHTLKNKGYKLLLAEDGVNALRTLADPAVRTDLVISDLVMPHMGGREMAQKLSQIRPKLKVIFMSGYTEDSLILSGGLDNAVAFVQKPIAPKEMLRIVRQELDGRGP
ncbi:MAG: ATP-binding protein, partial [Elusimicrobiota bacterium]